MPATDLGARLALALGIVLGAAACSSTPHRPAVHEVTIHGMAFDPATLTAAVGDVIVWTNADVVPHTATAAGTFDSGPIAPAQIWRLTVAAAGNVTYGCTLHPTMQARLLVR